MNNEALSSENVPTISAIKLIEAGYRDTMDRENNPWFIRTWHKQIKDDRGIKYNIIVRETLGFNSTTEDEKSRNWWPRVQFEVPIKDQYQALNIELVQWLNESGLYSNLTIADIEEYVDGIWVALGARYYELQD